MFIPNSSAFSIQHSAFSIQHSAFSIQHSAFSIHLNTDFLLQSSPWYLPLCLLVGGAYAFLLYQKNAPWSKRLNLALSSMRFFLVSGLCFLLLGILLKQTKTSVEKKTVVLAIDNSQSVGAAGNRLRAGLKAIQEALSGEKYAVEIQTLNDERTGSLDSVRFNVRTTNLSNMLSRIRTTYEGRNLTDVVLLSDGIVNQGTSPTYGTYPFAIQTLGVGDTLPKRDVALKAVYANKIAYLGNQFPVSTDVLAYGYPGQSTRLQLRQGPVILDQKTVTFGPNQTLLPLTFSTTAKQKGLQHYTLEAVPLGGEFTTRNNRQEVYIDVIDGKEKILLAALTPHPDVKALRAMLEKNENFEVDVQVFNTNSPPPPSDKKYDLIVLHQLPDLYNSAQAWTKRLVESGAPCLFVLGNQSNTPALNALNGVVQVVSNPGQSDKVTGFLNANFKLLNFDPQRLDLLRKLPPLSVPFGDVRLLPNAQAVLFQRVGTVQTQKPLLVVGTGQKRGAVLLGEGLWQWRLEEFALTEKQELVDDLLMKVVQYIAAKDDKRKLRVYPLQNEFQLGDRITFETEAYNDIYERLYDLPIALTLTDERARPRSYNYTITSGSTRFEVSDLPAGVYRYRAAATVLGKAEVTTGEFVVKDEPLEALSTTADFNLLRQLAQQTGGRFYPASQIESLRKNLLSRNVPDRLSSTEDLRELINLRWLFFVLLLLVTAEWGIRKWAGSY